MTMRSFNQWVGLVLETVKTTPDKAKEIAAICYHDERSGGIAGTWHGSAIVHGNNVCNCYHCKKGGSY